MDDSLTYDPAPLWFTPESANVEALEQAWGARKLSQIMGAALGSFNRLGHVDAGTASDTFGVSEGTIRRWIRDGVPPRRIEHVIGLVRPPQGAFEQERKDLVYARGAVTKIETTGDWGVKLAEVKSLSDISPWRMAVVLETSDQSARVGFQPGRDAFQVQRLKEAGAVCLTDGRHSIHP